MKVRNSVPLRKSVLNVVKAISIIKGSTVPPDNLSDSGSDSSVEEHSSSLNGSVSDSAQQADYGTELEQLMRGISKLIANLFKLSTVIRQGNASRDRQLKSSKIDVSFYESWDVHHVKSRFPKASERIISRMGLAISRRRQYLKHREQHHERLARPLIHPKFSNTVIDKEREHLAHEPVFSCEATPTKRSANHATSDRNPSSNIQSTNASTFLASKGLNPIDLNVDVYSEADTQSSHATSLVGEEKLRVPPPPKASRDGLDFECSYCYNICRLTGAQEWQRSQEWK